MKKIIEVKNLIKEFKIRTNQSFFSGLINPKYEISTAVNNISFEIAKGESVAFLGPNGAGKTTTTKMLSGLVYPTSGFISVLDYTPFERNKKYLKQIGLVMGNKSGLSWDLTGEQALRFVKEIYDVSDSDFNKSISKFGEILEVEKYLNRQIRKLSLGERMKIELIGAILHNPKVLFLDEPTIGLDVTSKKNIRNFLKEIQKNEKVTILLTSHDMDDIETVCERVIVINKGEKVYDNSINELLQNYKDEKFIKVYFEQMPDDLEDFEEAVVEKIEDDSVIFSVKKRKTPKLISNLIEKYDIIDIDIISIPLEEIIEDIYKKTK